MHCNMIIVIKLVVIIGPVDLKSGVHSILCNKNLFVEGRAKSKVTGQIVVQFCFI